MERFSSTFLKPRPPIRPSRSRWSFAVRQTGQETSEASRGGSTCRGEWLVIEEFYACTVRSRIKPLDDRTWWHSHLQTWWLPSGLFGLVSDSSSAPPASAGTARVLEVPAKGQVRTEPPAKKVGYLKYKRNSMQIYVMNSKIDQNWVSKIKIPIVDNCGENRPSLRKVWCPTVPSCFRFSAKMPWHSSQVLFWEEWSIDVLLNNIWDHENVETFVSETNQLIELKLYDVRHGL